MAKISTLHINNFKFFGESDPIDVGGKHLLIYGENGSGKSSIYWALYTLLECSRKNEASIKKYFDKNHDNSLVNNYADVVGPDDWNSFISATLDDSKEYRIAITDTALNKNTTARESSRASDFLTYRFAYKIHDFRHGQEVELFELFLKEIFPYTLTKRKLTVQKDTDTKRRDIQDLRVAWSYLDRGLTRHNNSQRRRVHYNSVWAKEYKQLAADFDVEVSAILGDIITFGNQVLDRLGYSDIKFTLDYSAITFGGYGDAETPTIKLRITEFAGQINPFKFPQSFLNEARLTAIALAIRLGFLESRLSKAELKLLVLDDLLISLDMSNRRRVLDLLLTQYAPTYQLFILTHDRAFYNFAEKKIKNEHRQEKDWFFMEMYENRLSAHPQPYIAKQKQNLKQAEDFYNEHNYPACGLFLRCECERLLEALLPSSWQTAVKEDGSVVEKDLNGKINSLKDFCQLEGIDYTPFNPLKIYKDVILNTLSHDDSESPLYADELKAVLEVVKKLSSIKRNNQIIKSGKDLLFRLSHPSDGRTLAVSVRTRDPFVLLEEDGNPPRLSYFGKCEVRKLNRGTGWLDEHQGYDDLKSLVDFYKQELDITDNFNMLDLLEYQGSALRTKLNPPNAPIDPAAE